MDYKDNVPIGHYTAADFSASVSDTNATSEFMRFPSIDAVLKNLRPIQPVHCLHPDRLQRAARMFVENFPGHSLYAIKANPDPYVLTKLHNAGINHFDVASLGEVQQMRMMFPDSHLAFMNPIKSREAIRSSYFDYGVRDFVVDCADEMNKVVEETDHAKDLLIVVRIAMPKGSAAYSLTAKFGCTPEEAVLLLQQASKVAARVGISFHVGSQTLDPSSYTTAIRKGGEVWRQSGVKLSVFDIGGGFPIEGLGMQVPPLSAFFDVIRAELAAIKLPKSCEVWAEPGRALSGTSSTLLVRVELRKGDLLYINDGSYGNMFEVCTGKWQNSVQLFRPARKNRKPASKNIAPFRLYGPTCDSVDYLPGPFLLPDDVNEGDWIAFDGMGAYTGASQTHFNGFFSDLKVEIIADAPAKRRAQLKVVK